MFFVIRPVITTNDDWSHATGTNIFFHNRMEIGCWY